MSKERLEELISKSKNDLKKTQDEIVEELVKIGEASENKKIDMKNPRVTDALRTLITAEPDKNNEPIMGAKPVLSINATIQNIQKNISKFVEKNLEYKNDFDKLQEEMAELPKKVEMQYSTQEGIDLAVTKFLKDKVIIPQVHFVKTERGRSDFLNITEKEEIFEKIGQNLKIPSSLITPMLRDPTLLKPLSNAIMENARTCFGEEAQLVKEACIINKDKLESKENIEKFTKLVNQNMQSFAMIQENLNPNISIEENKKIASALLPAISKLPPEKMTEQGSNIIKDFAPLLESKNPALVNGTKKLLAELDPGFLTEHGRGESIALELQRVAKPKIWQRIVKVFTGTDYAQQNIDKAFANFKESNRRHIYIIKNLPEELKKEDRVKQKQARQQQDKGTKPVKAKIQGLAASTPHKVGSHVENLNKNRNNNNNNPKLGHSK